MIASPSREARVGTLGQELRKEEAVESAADCLSQPAFLLAFFFSLLRQGFSVTALAVLDLAL